MHPRHRAAERGPRRLLAVRPDHGRDLKKAKDENKPIFLSIGYSSCHWCHVMAHESFEDKNTAAVMNEKFINIKVDREERPDLDNVFQKSLAILSGTPGGWPLSMFLDENGVPFTGGTYFPPKEMYGRPSFINMGSHDKKTNKL